MDGISAIQVSIARLETYLAEGKLVWQDHEQRLRRLETLFWRGLILFAIVAAAAGSLGGHVLIPELLK